MGKKKQLGGVTALEGSQMTKELDRINHAKTIMEQLEVVIDILGLSCSADDVFNSNSKGELFHVSQLIGLTKDCARNKETIEWLAKVVPVLEKEMLKTFRDQGIRETILYQHIPEIIFDVLSYQSSKASLHQRR